MISQKLLCILIILIILGQITILYFYWNCEHFTNEESTSTQTIEPKPAQVETPQQAPTIQSNLRVSPYSVDDGAWLTPQKWKISQLPENVKLPGYSAVQSAPLPREIDNITGIMVFEDLHGGINSHSNVKLSNKLINDDKRAGIDELASQQLAMK